MAEQPERPTAARTTESAALLSPPQPRPSEPSETEVRAQRGIAGPIVWATLTLGFLAFLSFGSITIHQWRWNFLLEKPQEDIERVRLMEIWTHQAARLPSVDTEGLLQGAFYIAVFGFVGGSIAAVWLLLDRAGTGTGRSTAPPHDA